MKLSEILVSLFLASLIMTSLFQVYLSSKAQYIQMSNLLDRRFDLLWITDLLAYSIRRAGFTPCLGIDQLQSIDTSNPKKPIQGLTIGTRAQQFLQIKRMSDYFAKIIRIESPQKIVLAETRFINAKHPLLIADCYHAEVHEIQHVEKIDKTSHVTLTKPLIFSYPSTTYAGEYLDEKWLIKQNQHKIKSFYYKLGQSEELSVSIHSLQITAIDNHGTRLLELILGLDDDKLYRMLVSVRSS